MKEIFRNIPGYEGLYQVSNFGRVKSLKKQVWMAYNQCYGTRKERILKAGLNEKGYLHVILCNSIRKTIKVHKLVAMAFLNHVPCGMKLVVDHLDFNKTNNHLSNLKLITNRENSNKKHLKSSSQYVGVHWGKHAQKWVSCITINGKNKHLGHFPNEKEASEAYQNKLFTLKQKKV